MDLHPLKPSELVLIDSLNDETGCFFPKMLQGASVVLLVVVRLRKTRKTQLWALQP